MTTQLLIDAASLIPFNDAVIAATAEKHALCDAFSALPEPRTYEQNYEFNRAVDVLDVNFQQACWYLALEVALLIEQAQVNA